MVALDNLSLGIPSNLSHAVTFVSGSVMDFDTVLNISKGCDYIFHSAALISSPMFKDDPRGGIEVNIIGFMNVMECAKRNNIKTVIFASSSSVYNVNRFRSTNLKSFHQRHSMRHHFIAENSWQDLIIWNLG